MTQICRIAFASMLVMAGCAHVPTDPDARADYERANDPAEPTNRAVFGANQVVDRNVLKPVATAYRDNVPDGVRRGVHNFVTNLGEPGVFVNDVLQGNVHRALNTTARFVVNSSAGVGGLFDVADDWGLPHHQADFGQTFGVWGIGPGPAVQLPLLGPSDVRDSVGSVLGFVANPLNQISGGTITLITNGRGRRRGPGWSQPGFRCNERARKNVIGLLRHAAQHQCAAASQTRTGGQDWSRARSGETRGA